MDDCHGGQCVGSDRVRDAGGDGCQWHDVVDVDPYDANLGLDPLPDIDFNIRCGNTLVGYATEQEIQNGLTNGDMFAYAELKGRIDDELQKAGMAFDFFRREQLNLTGDHRQLVAAKNEVHKRLASVRTLLDDQLYDRHSGKTKKQWLADTQPFHWYTEFYPIMHGHKGFDVVIGNPPYVEYSKTKKIYELHGYDTISCGNLYAMVFERATRIVNSDFQIGMIFQLPIICTDRMKRAQDILAGKRSWLATFDDRPGKLFDDLEHIRSTIFITSKNTSIPFMIWGMRFNVAFREGSK